MTTLIELAYHNALAFQELEFGLINARLDNELTPEQVEELIFSDQKIDFPTLRSYALAVGAKVTITVETVEVEKSDYTKGELMTPACREGGHEYCPAKYTPMTCNCNCHEEEN